MKTKWRCIFLGTVIFIIFISFKILEPELLKRKQNNAGDPEDVEETVINLYPDSMIEGGIPVTGPSAVKRSQVIQSMSDRFSPVYSYHLKQSPWETAAQWVEPRHIHPENVPQLGSILLAMSKGNVTSADVGYKGTQLKLTLVLNGKQKVVFKPAWYSRDTVITGTPYEGRDRHNGEIAAFHLGRILELRRTPLAIGRKLDVQREILSVASQQLAKTFFEQDGELCFYGKCLYCKGPEDGICSKAGQMEGTLILWLPPTFKLLKHKHPWARTYRKNVEPKWTQRSDWCEIVKKHELYNKGPLLLDIIDTAIFDFIIGNADRHMYETFDGHADSMLIMLDNGKSFGNPDHDEMTILAPLYQCCIVRSQIWQRLLAIKDGILSQVLGKVLSHDPLHPVLTNRHLEAMDRRVELVLEKIEACIDQVGINAIIMDS